MKKIIAISLLTISSVAMAQTPPPNPASGFPQGQMAPKGTMGSPGMMERHRPEITKENFAEHKKRILDHMSKMDEAHKKQKSCIEASQVPEDMKKCHEDMKEFHKNLREEMREHNEMMKKQREDKREKRQEKKEYHIDP